MDDRTCNRCGCWRDITGDICSRCDRDCDMPYVRQPTVIEETVFELMDGDSEPVIPERRYLDLRNAVLCERHATEQGLLDHTDLRYLEPTALPFYEGPDECDDCALSTEGEC